MIKVIIVLINAFIVWVLFFSKFSKERKIALVASAVILSFLGLWYESGADKPRRNIVNENQIVNCGVKAKHSYRTNFDIELCLRNTAKLGDIKRISLFIIAKKCQGSDECIELERVARDLTVDISAQSSTTLIQNLSFANVESNLQDVEWSFVVRSVKASK